MRLRFLIAGVAVLMATPVLAHEGQRVWIDQAGGKIVTYTSNNDLDPLTYTPSRLFGSELLNFFDVYTTDFPGYEVRRSGAQVGSNTTFGFNITGPLLVFDDLTGSYLTAAPQMAVSMGSTAAFSSTGKVAGFNFFTYSMPGAGDHAHLAYTMVWGGVPFNGPAGVYALPLNLTAAGLAASDTYYLLLGKGVSPASPAFAEARDVMQTMIDFPGDADLDGQVGTSDLTRLAAHWQGAGRWIDGDFNFDGLVNIHDLYILASHWETGTAAMSQSMAELGPPSVTVPEPGSMGIVGCALLLCRRRSQFR